MLPLLLLAFLWQSRDVRRCVQAGFGEAFDKTVCCKSSTGPAVANVSYLGAVTELAYHFGTAAPQSRAESEIPTKGRATIQYRIAPWTGRELLNDLLICQPNNMTQKEWSESITVSSVDTMCVVLGSAFIPYLN